MQIITLAQLQTLLALGGGAGVVLPFIYHWAGPILNKLSSPWKFVSILIVDAVASVVVVSFNHQFKIDAANVGSTLVAVVAMGELIYQKFLKPLVAPQNQVVIGRSSTPSTPS